MEHEGLNFQPWTEERLDALVPGRSCLEWNENDLRQYATFNSLDEAFNFYHCYSLKIGFGIRAADIQHTPQKVGAYRVWKCCKAGFKKTYKEGDQPRKQRKVTRCGCKARLTVQWQPDENRYRVLRFTPDHNHPHLSKGETLTLPSNTRLTHAQKQVARELGNAGIRPCKIMSYMANEAGGFEYLGFTPRNLYNFMNADMAEELEDGDAQAMLNYLACKVRGGDDLLYCRYTVDEQNQLCHLFWADSESIRDFHRYPFVILFDATYKTNGYGMPLVLIVGVNNHYQTVVFGACLMRDETTASYLWLLETFMLCMKIKEGPALVITDSDRAIIAAVKLLWSNSLHRLCSWHINRNFLHHVRSVEFRHIFNRCMTHIKTEEDFEEIWQQGIVDHGLEDNDWLQLMYEHRRLWVEFYFAEVFSARQHTTSRSESANAFFKHFLRPGSKLYRFMLAWDEGMVKLRQTELQEDVLNKTSEPHIREDLGAWVAGWLRSAAEIYTRAIFFKIEEQILEHLSLCARRVGSDEHGERVYSVWQSGTDAPARTVTWSSQLGWVHCSCGYLTEMGIPCRHIFVVMKYEGFWKIPESVVLKRWTMDACNTPLPPEYGPDAPKEGPYVDTRRHSRVGMLDSMWSKVRDSAAKTDEGFAEAVNGLKKLQLCCDDHARSHAQSKNQTGNASTADFSECSNIVRDPVRVRTKGSAPETSTAKKSTSHHCSRCKQSGHNKKTCTQPAPEGGPSQATPEHTDQQSNYQHGSTSDFQMGGGFFDFDFQSSQHAWRS